MKYAVKTATFGFLVALLSTSIASAERPGRHGPRGLSPARIDRIAQKLNMSDELVAKIKTVVYASQAKAIDKRAVLQKARLDLRQLMDQDTPDRTAVMKSLDRVGLLETEMKKHQVDLLLSVSELLTPQQRKEFKALMRKRSGKHGWGPHRKGKGDNRPEHP